MPRSTIANEGGSKKVTTTTAGVKELLDIGIYDDAGALIDIATEAKQNDIITELQTINTNTTQSSSYGIMETDTTGSPKYYGYESKTGIWYIMRESSSSVGNSYVYASGSSNFETNWINRVALSYVSYSNAF